MSTKDQQNSGVANTFDYLYYVKKVIRHWYVLIVFLLLGWYGSKVYLKYQDRIYNIQAKVLIRDQNQMSNQYSFIDDLMLPSGYKHMENEIARLRSYDFVKKLMLKQTFYINKTIQGDIINKTQYKNEAPYRIDVLKNQYGTPLLYGVRFQIKPGRTKDKVHLKASANAYVSLFETDSLLGELKIDVDTEYAYGDTLSFGDCCFVINKTEQRWATGEGEPIYQFSFLKLDYLVRSYQYRPKMQRESEGSSLLIISMNERSIERAQDYLNLLLRTYIQEDLQQKNQIIDNSIAFIDEQLLDLSRQMKIVEGNIDSFRDQNEVFSYGSSPELIGEKLMTYENSLAQFDLQKQYYLKTLNYLTNNDDVNDLIAPSSVGIQDEYLAVTIQDLKGLYSQKAALSITSSESSHTVKIINLKIKQAKEAFLENLNNNLEMIDFQISNAKDKIAVLRNSMSDIPESQRVFENIQQQLQLNKNLYNFLVEKKTSAGIARSLNTPDNKILDQARLSKLGPVLPNTNKTQQSFLIASLVFFALYVLVREFIWEKIEGKNHVELITGTKLLAQVWHNTDKSSNPLNLKSGSITLESFRNMRVNLNYRDADSPMQVIAFTSTLSGEGKTFCATYLAASYANMGKRVLLVGTDLRKPKLGSEFELNKNIGVVNYLINQNSFDEVVQETGGENLNIITSGPIPPNPNELLASKRFDELIGEAKNRYDIVILDCSPVGLVSDYLVVDHLVDSVVYVVRNKYTKVKAAKYWHEFKTKVRADQTVSVILNDVVLSSIKGYGSYGYGYGYGYGHEKKKKKFGFLKNG